MFFHFLNFESSAAALVFDLPLCTLTDTEGKPRKARVRNIFKNSSKNTIFNEHPVLNIKLNIWYSHASWQLMAAIFTITVQLVYSFYFTWWPNRRGPRAQSGLPVFRVSRQVAHLGGEKYKLVIENRRISWYFCFKELVHYKWENITITFNLLNF